MRVQFGKIQTVQGALDRALDKGLAGGRFDEANAWAIAKDWAGGHARVTVELDATVQRLARTD